VKPSFLGFTGGLGITVGGLLFDVAYIYETGDVPASREQNGIKDATRNIRYNRLFASVMFRFGPRR
jgi:multisubunit Na+/H+ antiporter MnhB subunit